MKVALVVGRRWHAPSLVRGMIGRGHRVTVFTSEPWDEPEAVFRRIPVRTLLRIGGRFPLMASTAYGAFSTFVKIVVGREKFDLVVAWSGFGKGLAGLAPRSILVRGSTHIATQREVLLAAESRVFPTSSMVRREMVEYREYGAVTVPTVEIARDVRWAETGTRVVIAPYAVDCAGRGERMSRSGEQRGLFVGEVSVRKGIDRFLNLALLAEVDGLDVVGGMRSGASLEGDPKVVWHGHVPFTTVQGLMRNSTFIAVLSREEGQARVGLEAMREGLPIIATAESGLADFCREGAGVVVGAGCSPDELAEAVKTLLSDWDAYSRRAYEIAARWSWEDHAAALEQALLPER